MYIQRQISAFLGNGTDIDPVQYGIADRLWTEQDVYPAKIQIISDGGVIADQISVAASGGTATLPLPQAHVAATSKLAFFLTTDHTVKVTIARPDSTTSVLLVRAGTSSDSPGAYAFTGLVTSILVTNAGTAAAIINYFCWDYPADITVGSAWRDGAQTTGTAPTE